jgi:hypothetical protein
MTECSKVFSGDQLCEYVFQCFRDSVCLHHQGSVPYSHSSLPKKTSLSNFLVYMYVIFIFVLFLNATCLASFNCKYSQVILTTVSEIFSSPVFFYVYTDHFYLLHLKYCVHSGIAGNIWTVSSCFRFISSKRLCFSSIELTLSILNLCTKVAHFRFKWNCTSIQYVTAKYYCNISSALKCCDIHSQGHGSKIVTAQKNLITFDGDSFLGHSTI